MTTTPGMAGISSLTVASQPYRWPYHGRFDAGRSALLITWDLSWEEESKALRRLRALAEAAAENGIPTIGLPRAGVPGPFPLAPERFTTIIRRPVIGCFTTTAIDQELRRLGRTDLLIAGIPFELGADCAMREGNDLGYECLAVTDCCTGASAETFAGAIKSITMSGGIFGAIATLTEVLPMLASTTSRGG